MKKYLSLISLIVLTLTTVAQNTGTAYIIKLKDKGTTFSLSEPNLYLSERSIERRLLQAIPLSETDLPVNPDYLNSLKLKGAEIFYTSKWLNTVIAYIDNENALNTIRTLDFVKEIRNSRVIDTKKNHQPFKRFFQQEKYEKVSIGGIKGTTVGFNYGPSANQAQMLKVDQLHNQGYTGNGMVIAVIDAGFNSADVMAVFDSLYDNSRILGTRDFVQPGNNVYSTGLSVHGTMVLSTMGGNLPGQIIGTAPHASYYLFRTEDATAEYLMEEYYWVQAAEYADSLGVDIFNTSLGYTRFDNPDEDHTYQDMNGDNTPITIGADMAAQKGILVINSAGNEGANPWHYISAPADGDSVMAVGAVDENGNYAYFSSVGPTFDGRVKPDVAAQGYNAIVASVPSGIAVASGTSFSSPIMTGAAACLWQANPTYSNMDIINAIKQSSSQTSNPNNSLGWGIPDFLLANSLLVGNINEINYSKEITCYPNPFNEYIIADFTLNSKTDAEIMLINSQGMVIKTVKSKNLNVGNNHIKFDNLNILPKGIYFIKVSIAGTVITQKVIK
jgi:serine protease AprX